MLDNICYNVFNIKKKEIDEWKKTLSVIYSNDNLKVKWKTKYNEWIKINFKKNNHLIHKGWFYMPDLNEVLLSNQDSNIKNKKYKLFKQRYFIAEYEKDNISLKIENKGRAWKEITINSKNKQDLIKRLFNNLCIFVLQSTSSD